MRGVLGVRGHVERGRVGERVGGARVLPVRQPSCARTDVRAFAKYFRHWYASLNTFHFFNLFNKELISY